MSDPVATLVRLLVGGLAATAFGCAREWRDVPLLREERHDVHVVSHGWHTGVVLSAADLGAELAFVTDSLGEVPYYEFGWGDRGFYQAEQVTTSLTLRAVLWPTDSVMHVVAVPIRPDRYFFASRVCRLPLSAIGVADIRDALSQSFARTAEGEPVAMQPGVYGLSRFFEGEGRYYLTNTCNTWTARILECGGVPIRTFLTLTAGSVLDQVEGALEDLYASRPDLEDREVDPMAVAPAAAPDR